MIENFESETVANMFNLQMFSDNNAARKVIPTSGSVGPAPFSSSKWRNKKMKNDFVRTMPTT